MKKLGLNKKQAEEGDTLFAHTCRLNVGYRKRIDSDTELKLLKEIKYG